MLFKLLLAKGSKTLFLLWLFISFFWHIAIGQVDIGERPIINIDSVSQDSYESGMLYIKTVQQKTTDNLFFIDEKRGQQIVKSSDSELNKLLKEFGADGYKNLFEHPLLSDKNRDKHIEWELNTWFGLSIDKNKNVVEAVKAFSSLSIIEKAEPVYKIVRYVNNSSYVVENSPRNIYPLNSDVSYNNSASDSIIEKRNKWTPNDPNLSSQWHYNKIELQQAWNFSKGESSVIVSIHDGGIDYLHSDLASNMWPSIGPDGTQTQADTHGTHVAGTVAAVNNNSTGVAGVAGGSFPDKGALLMSLDIFEGSISTQAGYVYAADNGAVISQNSWGYLSPSVYNSSDLLGIDYFYANGGGAVMPGGGLVIFAAGNDNSSEDWYPGYYSKTMAVAATTQSDIKATFSNYGSWVDISAPGVNIYSTYVNNSYAYLQGTSMACPHVSGVAALIVSYSPGTFSRSQVETALLSSTDNIDSNNPTYANLLGTGRLNALKAIEAVQNIQGLNPNTFVAEAIDKDQINLSWNKNSSNDDVLIAFNANNHTFGIPSGDYQPGDFIAGGGTVLYYGSETTFEHTELLPQRTYYYRAYSRLSDGSYSAGVLTSTMTLCDVFSNFPFSQEFDESYLPVCWSTVSNEGGVPGQVWAFKRITNGLPLSYGTYAVLDSESYGKDNTQDSDLITPSFDFTNDEEVFISFHHYYRHYNNSKATFSVSLDGGTSWQTLDEWESTTPNPRFYAAKVDVAAGKSDVKFKWNYTGTWAYYWCIDNVLISNEQTASISDVEFLVVDENKNPIQDATVSFDHQTQATNTDGISQFSISYEDDIFNGEYSITAQGYNNSGGVISIESSSEEIKIILISENSQQYINGETSVCRGSEVFYWVDNDYAGLWQIVGGEIIDEYEGGVLVKWTNLDGDGLARFNVVDNEGYNIMYEQIVAINHFFSLANADKPSIYVKGNLPILICESPDVQYQWVISGSPVLGENKQFFVSPSESGDIQVQTIDANECPHTSDVLPYLVESFSDNSGLTIYPNPSYGDFEVEYKSDNYGDGSLLITDLHGKIIHNKKLVKKSEVINQRISIPNLSPGIYFIELRINDSSTKSRITIIN